MGPNGIMVYQYTVEMFSVQKSDLWSCKLIPEEIVGLLICVRIADLCCTSLADHWKCMFVFSIHLFMDIT